MDTEFAMRDGEDNVKALFRQGQVGDFPETVLLMACDILWLSLYLPYLLMFI